MAPDEGVGVAAVNASASSSSDTASDDANSGENLSISIYDDGDEEEEDVCRICRSPGDADNPLRYPCACSGTIKFVHQDCLLLWLNKSKARQCEVCKHPFSFSPVYAENAPAKLSFQELVVGISMKACHELQFFFRITFVLSVWLVIIPFTTFWIWQLSFVKSFNEAQMLFLNHISITVILTDCIHGFLLCASIVLIVLGVASLKDYFRHLRGIQVAEGDERDRNGALVARGPPNRNLVGVNAGQMIRRNAENVAARMEIQAPRLEVHVELRFDDLDNGDGAEDVPFDELYRMLAHLPFLLATSYVLKQAVSLANITLKNTLTAVASLTSDDYHNNTFIDHVGLTESSNSIIQGETTGASSWVSDAKTLAVGYICIFSVVIFYYGTVAVIRYSKGEPMGRFYGIVESIPSLFKQILTAMKHLMTMIKVAFFLVVELGGFPLMCGWWLDICTIRMFGKSISLRVDIFSEYPFVCSLIHWSVGIVYMLLLSIFVSLLRGVLRNGVLYFLQEPAEPNYTPLYLLLGPGDPNFNPFRNLIDDPVHKHARRFLLSVAVYGSLIVMLVYLPVKLAMRMAPSVFPLDILASANPASMFYFQMCIPILIDNFKLPTTIKSLLHCWFTAVGWALGLTDFLLPKPEDNDGENGNRDPVRQDRLHARPGDQDRVIVGLMDPGDMNRIMHAETDGNGRSCSERHGFVLCIVLLLLAAWITLLIFGSMIIVVPTSLGRAFFNAITHGMKCDDGYAFIIGIYITLTVLACARCSIHQIKTKRATVLLGQLWKWCPIVIKSSLLLSIWIFVIPVLIGLLFELLVVVPMRLPVDESPVFILSQDWAFGLIVLNSWSQLVMLDWMTPLVGDSWRVKFERVIDDGFSRLQGFWVLQDIVIPIVMKLLTALCFPYVLARVFPVFGYPLVVNSAVYRYAWLGYFGFCLVCFCAKRLHAWFTDLHNYIRDDLYLIGRRLHDFGEDKSTRYIAMNNDVADLEGGLRQRRRLRSK
ncbi:hypothetical protein L1987_31867 [Smallanthus sonchifolius]|uniref:Uncharacterized protein n=1 Tax=Smallanthus sonchifolius TaxID=185202 RepID=A0ACB9I6L0_9ASTR|nr:hypothetical protein L1987_31867 [Smallanthus sonchifolius]